MSISFDQFAAMKHTPVTSQEMAEKIQSMEARNPHVADLGLTNSFAKRDLSYFGTWATYLGDKLLVQRRTPSNEAEWDSYLKEQYQALRDKLNNEFIIVEYNWAGYSKDKDGVVQPAYGGLEETSWCNFHQPPFGSDDNSWNPDLTREQSGKGEWRAGIFRLARAVRDTPIEGAWLTDFYKGIMTRDMNDLRSKLRKIKPADRREVEEVMVSILKDEERALGADHPIWLIGGYNPECQSYLAHELAGDETWRVITIPHHSGLNLGKVRGKESERRWSQFALSLMYDRIAQARNKQGKPWNVDAAVKAEYAAARPSAKD